MAENFRHSITNGFGGFEIADGLGISNANENTTESLQQYHKLLHENNKNKTNKELLIAILCRVKEW